MPQGENNHPNEERVVENIENLRKRVRGQITTLIAIVLVFVLGALTGWNLTDSDSGSVDAWPYFVLIAATILIISMLKERHYEKTAIYALSQLPELFKVHKKDIESIIQKHLTPSIRALDTPDKVLIVAAELINKAMMENQDADQFVCFIGSASLAQIPGSGDDHDEYSPSARYRSVVAQASQRRLRITRYISLLEPEDYVQRSQVTREAYLSWLLKQVAHLESNTHYQILNCPRAQKWGGSRSTLITNHGVLDVVGNGITGILLRGDEVARSILQGSENLFLHAHAKPDAYDNRKLEKYIAKLKELALDATTKNSHETVNH